MTCLPQNTHCRWRICRTQDPRAVSKRQGRGFPGVKRGEQRESTFRNVVPAQTGPMVSAAARRTLWPVARCDHLNLHLLWC